MRYALIAGTIFAMLGCSPSPQSKVKPAEIEYQRIEPIPPEIPVDASILRGKAVDANYIGSRQVFGRELFHADGRYTQRGDWDDTIGRYEINGTRYCIFVSDTKRCASLSRDSAGVLFKRFDIKPGVPYSIKFAE